MRHLQRRMGGVDARGPSREDCHVWYVVLDGDRDHPASAEALAMLTPDERRRYRAFRHAGARRQYLAGRVLVRTTLSRHAATALVAWRFTTTTFGRKVRSAGGMS